MFRFKRNSGSSIYKKIKNKDDLYTKFKNSIIDCKVEKAFLNKRYHKKIDIFCKRFNEENEHTKIEYYLKK
jgi:hypothetical protein